jgi:hypothetical protein
MITILITLNMAAIVALCLFGNVTEEWNLCLMEICSSIRSAN